MSVPAITILKQTENVNRYQESFNRKQRSRAKLAQPKSERSKGSMYIIARDILTNTSPMATNTRVCITNIFSQLISHAFPSPLILSTFWWDTNLEGSPDSPLDGLANLGSSAFSSSASFLSAISPARDSSSSLRSSSGRRRFKATAMKAVTAKPEAQCVSSIISATLGGAYQFPIREQ